MEHLGGCYTWALHTVLTKPPTKPSTRKEIPNHKPPPCSLISNTLLSPPNLLLLIISRYGKRPGFCLKDDKILNPILYLMHLLTCLKTGSIYVNELAPSLSKYLLITKIYPNRHDNGDNQRDGLGPKKCAWAPSHAKKCQGEALMTDNEVRSGLSLLSQSPKRIETVIARLPTMDSS